MHRRRMSFAGLAFVLLAPAAAAQSSFFDVVSVERTLESHADTRGVPAVDRASAFEGTGPFDLELSAVAFDPETGARRTGVATLESDVRLSRVRVAAFASALAEPAPFNDTDSEFIYPTGYATAHVEYVFEVHRPAQIQILGMFSAGVTTPYKSLHIDAGVQLVSPQGEGLFEIGFHPGTEEFDELIPLQPGIHSLSISVDAFHNITSVSGELRRASSLDVDVRFIPAPATAAPLLMGFGVLGARRRRGKSLLPRRLG